MIQSQYKPIRGVYSALPTFFKWNDEIDLVAYEKLILGQMKAGVNGFVPCGTTGETPTLTESEKESLISLTVKLCKGKALIIAGTGTNDTRTTITGSQKAEALGADALLVVTPYYNKPSQRGLLAHYLKLADSVKIPIVLYNVPGRTAVSLTVETVATLSQHPNIVAIKEATGNLPLFLEMKEKINASQKKGFTFLTGDDPTYWPFLTSGGDGVISVGSNIIPATFVELFRYCEQAKLKEGAKLFEKLLPIMNGLFIESNPVPLKYLLARNYDYPGDVRLPLVNMSEQSITKLNEIWTQLPESLRSDLPRTFIEDTFAK